MWIQLASMSTKDKSVSEQVSSAPLMSMTGFGKGSAEGGGTLYTVELRSVNNRFLDCYIKLGRGSGFLEAPIKEVLSASLFRGRVEVTVNETKVGSEEGPVLLDVERLKALLKGVEESLKAVGAYDSSTLPQIAASLVTRQELLLNAPLDSEAEKSKESEIQQAVVSATKSALLKLLKARESEGRELEAELRKLIGEIDSLATSIRSEVQNIQGTLLERTKERIAELKKRWQDSPGEEIVFRDERVAEEAAYLLDRMDVQEELVRIFAHLKRFSELLLQRPCGRSLEFLLQEFGREFNTLSSKVQNSTVQHQVVRAKQLLEQLREQVQNIE